MAGGVFSARIIDVELLYHPGTQPFPQGERKLAMVTETRPKRTNAREGAHQIQRDLGKYRRAVNRFRPGRRRVESPIANQSRRSHFPLWKPDRLHQPGGGGIVESWLCGPVARPVLLRPPVTNARLKERADLQWLFFLKIDVEATVSRWLPIGDVHA